MSLLTKKNIIVTGAGGALGSHVVNTIKSHAGTPIQFDLGFRDAAKDGDIRFELDLTDRAQVEEAVGKVRPIAGVFNIAGGFAMGKTAYDPDDEDWSKMTALNVTTVRNMIKAVVPVMMDQGHGAIVNVGAYAALSGPASMSAYTASKGVVMKLTETLAEEVRGKGINVNAVLPTIIDTPANRGAMPDANPAEWVSPECLAQTMCFLASEGAKDIHGALIPVRGLS